MLVQDNPRFGEGGHDTPLQLLPGTLGCSPPSSEASLSLAALAQKPFYIQAKGGSKRKERIPGEDTWNGRALLYHLGGGGVREGPFPIWGVRICCSYSTPRWVLGGIYSKGKQISNSQVSPLKIPTRKNWNQKPTCAMKVCVSAYIPMKTGVEC